MLTILPFALYFIWSLTFPIGKTLVGLSTPIFLTGFRMILAGLVLIGYLAFKRKLPQKFTWRHTISIFLLALLSIYVTNILEFWGLKYLSAGKTCFIYSLSPFIAALLSYFHFGERMTKKKWLGLSIGVLGFIPVILEGSSSEGMSSLFWVFGLPELAIALAAFCSIYGWIILRILVKDKDGISPLYANGSSMLIGGVLALATSFWTDCWNPIPVETGAFPKVLLLTLTMMMLSNLFCYNLYGYLLKRLTATILSFIGLLSPIFTSIHSWIILHEPPSLPIILSTFIVLAGLWLVYEEELKQGYVKPAKKEPDPSLSS